MVCGSVVCLYVKSSNELFARDGGKAEALIARDGGKAEALIARDGGRAEALRYPLLDASDPGRKESRKEVPSVIS